MNQTEVRLILASVKAQDSEQGQGIIEYGLIIALISIAAIVVMRAVGLGLIDNFQLVLNAL